LVTFGDPRIVLLESVAPSTFTRPTRNALPETFTDFNERSTFVSTAPWIEFETASFSVHKLFPKHLRKPVYAGRIVVPEWDIDIAGKFSL